MLNTCFVKQTEIAFKMRKKIGCFIEKSEKFSPTSSITNGLYKISRTAATSTECFDVLLAFKRSDFIVDWTPTPNCEANAHMVQPNYRK